MLLTRYDIEQIRARTEKAIAYDTVPNVGADEILGLLDLVYELQCEVTDLEDYVQEMGDTENGY